MRKINASRANGTGLKGYVDASYAELVAQFGEPHTNGDGYKADAEWVLWDDVNNCVVTIYNYKTGRNYRGGAGTPLAQERDWHIGGSGNAVLAMQRYFPQARNAR